MGAWIETAKVNYGTEFYLSHPVWVRGLKLYELPRDQVRSWSHPVWVRGLKPNGGRPNHVIAGVAPRVGAWIETVSFGITSRIIAKSHPVWVRGLKLLLKQTRNK